MNFKTFLYITIAEAFPTLTETISQRTKGKLYCSRTPVSFVIFLFKHFFWRPGSFDLKLRVCLKLFGGSKQNQHYLPALKMPGFDCCSLSVYTGYGGIECACKGKTWMLLFPT